MFSGLLDEREGDEEVGGVMWRASTGGGGSKEGRKGGIENG
jgi:hypothetical protein